jgi:hypothetical protein
MQREQDNILPGGGGGTWWHEIVNADAKGAEQRTSWRWRGSVIVSDCGRECEKSRTTYSLEVEREHDCVRLRMWMQREQGNVLPGGGEGA